MKKWTIMVYMAGDNNLSLDMAYALEEIKSATELNENVSLYVYFDGASKDVPTLYCEFEKGKAVNYYRSWGIKDKLIDVPRIPNENSAMVDNIINFIDWCVDKHRDEVENRRYAFILSGHSIGFLNWGLYRDENADYSMTHPKLKYLFEQITWDRERLGRKAIQDEEKHFEKHGHRWSEEYKHGRTKVILGKKLDLLGFDSCDMSTLEIASQFKDFAHTMVGSEGSIPDAGWNYAGLLSGRLKDDSEAAPDAVAISFVENFVKQQNKFAIADISVDMTAWDLSKLPELESSFGHLAKALLDCLEDDTSIAYRQTKRLLVHAHSQCQRYILEQNIDLGDFCQLLIDDIDLLREEIDANAFTPIGKLQSACKKVKDAVENCILITGFSGCDFQFSTGVSLFFPWSWSSYLSACEDYKKLTFISGTESGQLWFAFLEKYLGDVTLRKSPQVTALDSAPASVVVYDTYGISVAPDDGFDFEDGRQPPTTGRQPPTTGRQPPTTGRQPPTTGRQPPTTGRQPPTTGRQPPTTGRMLGSLPMFLSRFTVMRNFERKWTIAGFRSKTVKFDPEPLPGAPPTRAAVRTVVVPGPTDVRFLNDLRNLLPDDNDKLRFDTIAAMTDHNGLSEEEIKRFGEALKSGVESTKVLDELEGRFK